MVKGKSSAIHAIGRRKSSVARVFVEKGDGTITVNGRKFEDYFGRKILQIVVMQPLVAVQREKDFNINALVDGGGSTGQAGAVRLGIARALVKMNEEARKTLRAAGLMTRDPRAVERKKYGRHGARRRPQYSKR